MKTFYCQDCGEKMPLKRKEFVGHDRDTREKIYTLRYECNCLTMLQKILGGKLSDWNNVFNIKESEVESYKT